MTRRLTRRAKDLVCMRQLAACAYCNRELCDAFEVDHVNERRDDDREENLVAACALCHAVKTRHVRLRRDWTAMRLAIAQNLRTARGRWRDGAVYDDLPEWLRLRVDRTDVRLHVLSIQDPASQTLDLSHFRYTGEASRLRHHTRSRGASI